VALATIPSMEMLKEAREEGMMWENFLPLTASGLISSVCIVANLDEILNNNKKETEKNSYLQTKYS
jgi:hypothetical protein